MVRGKVVNLTSFGAFTKLEEGIEGLIHISELADRRIEKPEEIVSVGDELDLKVINLSPKDRRIGLSLKALLAEQERAAAPDGEEKPARTRSERPARSRREREPRRQLPAHEETVTTLGALLKEEMGKSNAENAESVESVEIVEDAENVETPESVEVVQDTDSAESAESAEGSDSSENVEDVESSESTEAPDNTENTEN